MASINSTIARNAAVAHVGGGIWARGDVFVTNSTVSNNYAEGQGGGVLAAGTLGLVDSTVDRQHPPVGGQRRRRRAARCVRLDHRPGRSRFDRRRRSSRRARTAGSSGATSFGYNFVTDASCGLGRAERRHRLGDVRCSGPCRRTADSARRGFPTQEPGARSDPAERAGSCRSARSSRASSISSVRHRPPALLAARSARRRPPPGRGLRRRCRWR